MTRMRELHHDAAALHAYNEKVLSELARLETTCLACVVTGDYLFELFIWLASVRRSWTFHPWKAVAFSPEESTVETIRRLGVPGLEARLLAVPRDTADWAANAALKVALVQHGGLERAVVSDLDNLFLAETPELSLYLDTNDYVFIGAPHSEWIIQTSLWGFRRTPAAIEFARRWIHESRDRPHSDASGLPFALRDHDDERLSVRVLAQPRADHAPHHPCPYDVQSNIRPFEFSRDLLGYSERHMGRAKVVHFGGIRSSARESVPARVRFLARHFAESWPVFPFYIECANEAAELLGLECIDDPCRFLSELSNSEPTLAPFRRGTDEAAELGSRVSQLTEELSNANERVRSLERQMRSSRWIFRAAGAKVLGFPAAELRRLRARLSKGPKR